MFNLFPREPAFFEMFNEAAQNMVLGSSRLKEMMESYEDVERKAWEIKRIESAGDAITHTIIRQLNQTFITPIDREDVYGLASAVDDAPDCVQGGSDRMGRCEIEKRTQEAIHVADLNYN